MICSECNCEVKCKDNCSGCKCYGKDHYGECKVCEVLKDVEVSRYPSVILNFLREYIDKKFEELKQYMEEVNAKSDVEK
jgi:hypothetical protein